MYGYEGIETPHLDAFRRDAILFERAYSHAPLTLPSHASLMTGLLPPQHGVRGNIGYTLDGHPTLASLLSENGYATGAAVSSYVLRRVTGIGKGFEFYEDQILQRGGESVGGIQRRGGETVAKAVDWLSQERDKPEFLFLHLFEPHTPYENSYDDEIRAVDRILGAFFQQLKQMNLYDEALIVILSDHGEGLGDHGEDEHGIFLYRESIQVPLVVKLPRQERSGKTVTHAVQLIDVMPSVLAAAGVKPPDGLSGRSLIEDSTARTVYSETFYPRIHLGWSDLQSVIDGDRHFIEAPRPELYDLSRDPEEKTNLAEEDRRALFELREQARKARGTFMAPDKIDPEEAAKLAALGYLGGTENAADANLPDPKDRIGEIAQMNAGVRLADRGEHDKAIAALRAVIAKNPRLTDAWTHLARTYELKGDFGSAVDAYRRSIQLAPAMSSDKALSLAALYLNLANLEEAEKHAQLAMRGHPAAGRIVIGRVALARRDLATAKRQGREAGSDPSSKPAALVLLAQVALIERDFGQAMSLADDAERLTRETGANPVPLVDYVRGNVHAFSGRAAEAEAAFRREIETFPHEREAYASLAVLQLLQGKGAEAEATMRRFVEANPGSASYLFAARTFAEVGDQRRAAAWRAKAR